MTEETKRCPKCGGEGVPIIYGLVPLVPGGPRPEIFKAEDRGGLRWGGCCVDPWSPRSHCWKCDLSFGDRDDVHRGARLYGEPLPVCIEPWPVRADGIEIGSVTSAANSPGFNCGVGIAMLGRGHWRPGEQVAVRTPDGARPATVADLPFILNSD